MGTFFRKFPRQRNLISINRRLADDHFRNFSDEFRLRFDWNSLLDGENNLLFSSYSKAMYPHADDLVRYIEDYARPQAPNIILNAVVSRITRGDNSTGPNDFQLDVTFRKPPAASNHPPNSGKTNGKTVACGKVIWAAGLRPHKPDLFLGTVRVGSKSIKIKQILKLRNRQENVAI